MNLKTYFEDRSQTELAAALGVTQGAVWQWAQGLITPAPERCVSIERATNAQVTRRDLRPADWHLIWPELVTPEHPAPAGVAASV